MERRIYFGFANSLFIGIYSALQLFIFIYASVGFILDGFSIMFNVTFIGSNAVFMVGKFIAIDFDSIFVFLNIASICLDVFLILANLSILCVLLTLDDT